jgi:hypothetical protein
MHHDILINFYVYKFVYISCSLIIWFHILVFNSRYSFQIQHTVFFCLDFDFFVFVTWVTQVTYFHLFSSVVVCRTSVVNFWTFLASSLEPDLTNFNQIWLIASMGEGEQKLWISWSLSPWGIEGGTKTNQNWPIFKNLLYNRRCGGKSECMVM